MLPGTASEVGVGRQSLLAGVDGCERQRGYCRVCSVTGDKRVAWIVRLVKTEADGEERCADVMKIDRPDDLADIADLGLTLAEGKLLLAGLQQEIVAAQARSHAVRRPDCRICAGVCHVKDCHVRFQGFRTQNPTRLFSSRLISFDAGMRGGGRALSDG